MNNKILSAELREIVQGFTYDKSNYTYSCLFCDARFEKGIIYTVREQLVDAHKAAKLHIEMEHDSIFNMLLSEDKKYTGLSDIQKDLLIKFYNGIPDKVIAKETDTSPSTVRFQRFSFREKAKQAKIILAISELLEAKCGQNNDLPKIHENATMVDERYMTTSEETDKIIKNFFVSLTPPVLKSFSSKEKNKLVILRIIAGQFEPSSKYTEKQVNEMLKSIYYDYATIRRYLIEYGFLDRSRDGGEYWIK